MSQLGHLRCTRCGETIVDDHLPWWTVRPDGRMVRCWSVDPEPPAAEAGSRAFHVGCLLAA